MSPRRFVLGSALPLVLPLALGLSAAAAPCARAELGKDRFELVDLSAWTLRAGELSVGPREVAFGFADVFEVKTLFPLNVFGAMNGGLKWLIHDDERIGVGVEAGFIHFDPALVGLDETFSVTAVPISVRASGRPNERLRLHGAIDFLVARPDEEAPDSVKRLSRHLFAASRLAVTLGAEVRFGAHVAAIAELEVPLIQHRKELRYTGEDDWSEFLRGTLSFHFVVESFNLRVGGGYGPSWLGRTGFFPTAELYFRVF